MLLGMAKENLGKFDLVGVTETFDDDFGHVLRHLGIDEPVPQERGLFRTAIPVTREDLSPATLAALEERLALDYALVDYVREKRKAGELI